MFDVLVVGAGVVGCAVARELSRYALKIGVVEAKDDVAMGATKANSAIVHAGFDAAPGSNKAKFNVLGNNLFEPLCRELGVPFIRNGSLVVAFAESEMAHLEELLERGTGNGVPELEILSQAELRKREPNISPEAVGALWAPTGGICCPYDLAFRLAENAAANGVQFRFNAPVEKVERCGDGWKLTLGGGVTLETKCVVNAAGVYSDILNNQVSAKHYNIRPRRGEYIMLDKSEAGCFSATMFQVPSAAGKGILISPTVDGTIIVGPTSDWIEDRSDTETSDFGLEQVKRVAARTWPGLPLRKAITTFSGIRAHETTGHDFVLGEPDDAPGFFNALGVESPGLTSSPAIGRYLAGHVAAKLGAAKKTEFSSDCGLWPKIREMMAAQIEECVARDPAYARVICRCETVSEAEIRAAIRCRVGARSLDGVKRRTRCGMGRCQGGFCTPRILDILSEELGIPQEEVTKSGGASKLLVGRLFGEDRQ